MDAWEKYGERLYLLLLHANFLDEPTENRQAFTNLYSEAASNVHDHQIIKWVNGPWREKLTAAWIAALRLDEALREPVAQNLLASSTCFAGQGLCICTARYRDKRASDTLVNYLETYLPVNDREYDQVWVLGALAWLDSQFGTNRALKYLSNPNLWKVIIHGKECGSLIPEKGIARVPRVMEFLDAMRPH